MTFLGINNDVIQLESFLTTVRTVNFVTFQKINGTKPKMIIPLCLEILSF